MVLNAGWVFLKMRSTKRKNKKPAAWVYAGLASILRRHLKQPTQSMKILHEATGYHKNKPYLFYHKGFACDALKQYKQAALYYRKALVLYKKLNRKPPRWLEKKLTYSLKKLKK